MHIEVTPAMREAVKRHGELQRRTAFTSHDFKRDSAEMRMIQGQLATIVIAAIEEQEKGK